MLPTGRSLYYDDGGRPKFLFYWTASPALMDPVTKEMLDMDSRQMVDVLETLPTRVPVKWVLCCYLTDNPGNDLCSTFLHFLCSRVELI